MNQYKITTFIFLLILTTVSMATIILNRNELIEAIKSNNIIEKMNTIYSTNVAFSKKFLSFWSMTQESLGTEILDDAEYGQIIKDHTGNLYFPSHDVDVSPYAQNVIRFSQLLKEKKIPFTYIQAPNKIVEGYTDKVVYQYNFSNQNADEFLNMLNESGVTTLDLRERILKSGIPKEELFYKTDHHWTTPTAFWAFQNIVKHLNQQFQLNIDEEYTKQENYQSIKKENCFLGSLGRRVGREVAGLDDYVLITPQFDTDYEIVDGSKGQVIALGDFQSAIIIDNILNSNDVEANKHATYFEWDYGDLIIKNHIVNNELKVLLVKDSYALPVGAFLSTCVKELHMVDLRDTPHVHLKEYIENNHFDAVVVLYNTEVFNDTMFQFK